MWAGVPGMSSAAGADVQETAVGEGAAQVVKVVAYHPAALVKNRPAPFIDPLRHMNIN